MKLCFIASANAIHSRIWIEYLVHKGYEIHWISLTENSFGNLKNVKFYSLTRFPIKALEIIYNAIPIRTLIKKINPDIIHAHYAGVNGVLGALSGFHPYILTAWGSDVLIAARSRVKRPLIRFALKKADLVTCNGEGLRKEIERLGINPQKIKLIYWGINVQKFKPGNVNRELRNRLGIFDSPIVISLRNLDPIYDVESLINSVPLVLKKIPETKFLIAGKGSQETKLKRLVESLGVAANIRFVGWISHDDLLKYLVSSDVYVSTSLSDGGLSQSAGQAMACELPIITTDLQVNRDWIRDGINGILVPVKNPQALAEKIIMLIRSKDDRIRLGTNGRKTIEDSLNFHREMEKVENLYKEMVRD